MGTGVSRVAVSLNIVAGRCPSRPDCGSLEGSLVDMGIGRDIAAKRRPAESYIHDMVGAMNLWYKWVMDE